MVNSFGDIVWKRRWQYNLPRSLKGAGEAVLAGEVKPKTSWNDGIPWNDRIEISTYFEGEK